ncbi:MAG: DUF4321 domain-containing protein [Firmicutes bacterium]|nr:DUF4321 domain-containing protein [Bacillota bacterium]MTI68773.1 DUF4321 domain-containing protein [Bacillota bacterium]
MRARNRNPWILILLLAVGLVLGGIIGDLLGDKIPLLAKSYSIGLNPPLHLDLNVLDLTFGFSLNLNAASAIGIILAILIFRKI